MLDTAGGDDVPRKGGPGVAMADLLVINKVDLAPYVGADVERMLSDASERRDGKPVLPASLRTADTACPRSPSGCASAAGPGTAPACR